MKLKKENILIAIILFINIIGLIGILNENYRDLFLFFTPFNLFLTASSFFYLNHSFNYKLVLASIIIYLFGFFIEVYGVYSGKLFGVYHYGESLGYKVLSVPLIIGVNWLFLSLATFGISSYFFRNTIFRIVLASVLMVVLDFLVEPIAIILDFWQWENNSIPIQNYSMWFVASLLIHSFIASITIEIKFKPALFIYMLQFLFFSLLNIFIS